MKTEVIWAAVFAAAYAYELGLLDKHVIEASKAELDEAGRAAAAAADSAVAVLQRLQRIETPAS